MAMYQGVTQYQNLHPPDTQHNTVLCVGDNPPTISINDDSMGRQLVHPKDDIKL